MIFWIGFTVMVLNEGFVIMRHVSPWFARRREALIARNVYILALAIWWGGVLSLVYIPKWLSKKYK